jgi:type II secretory pathway component GspD/PulD (secretin)
MSKSWLASLLVIGIFAAPGCSSVEEKAPAKQPTKKPTGEQAAKPAPKKADAKPQAPADKQVAKGAPAAAKSAGSDTRESLSPGGALLPNEALDRFNKQDGLRMAEEKALAQHYYDVGKKLFDEMDYSRAYENLRAAVERDPTHQAATELYYTCGAILGKREDELKASIERIRSQLDVKIELAKQEMIRFFEAGDKAFQAGSFDQAIRDLERAREMIAWFPYPIDSGTPPYRERAEKMIAEAKRKRLQADLEKNEIQEREAVVKAREAEKRKQKEDERRIQTMLDQTGDLIQARRYKEAKELAVRTLEIDPHNPFAKKYLEYATLGIHMLVEEGLMDRKHEERWANDENNERVAQPQEGTYIKFPDNWMEKTADRREGIATEVFDEPFWVKNYKKILRERKVTLNFPDVPLQDVILFLQDITGLNFVIAQGVDATERRISLRLKDIVLENALKIILEQTKLSYIFDKESIIIAEPGAAAGETYFDIYDVSDILYKIQDFTAHRLSLPNPDAPGGSGGGASLIFDDQAAEGEGSINADVLIEIIKGATGADEAWADGTAIEGHRGQLLVTNIRDVHRKINEVLENLRRNQGLFVHIETRFVDITNDMLEDVGVDFRGLGGNPGDTAQGLNPIANTSNPFGQPMDMNVDANRFGGTDVGGSRKQPGYPNHPGGQRLSATGQPLPFPGPEPEPGFDNFVYRTMNIFGSSLGANVLRGSRLAGGGGLSLMISQLDHWQSNAILRAEAQQSKVRRLTAPRVTAANREKVYTSVITQRAYIADWELVSGGTGLVVVEVADPIIQTFQEGVVLEVRPTISADRKFVTLDVRPSMATLVGGQISTIVVNLGSLAQSALQVPIGIPEITLEEAFTSVTIPDGGTALLGGFRQVFQQEHLSTLPIIDSIPVLNFLFKRRGDLKETRSLIVLITAKIVSIREEEGKRFNKK